jgi:hypothetical protein
VENKQSLKREEMMMFRWMCEASVKNRKTSRELLSRVTVDSVSEVGKHGRLRWFGHVKKKSDDDWTKKCQKMKFECNGG